MSDANDMDLVREFARDNSEAAFAELVRRHIALVYSVARRCTGNDGDAHDVTQAVFIILARKAAGLREKTLLTGWLYETTRFAAARLLRTNVRRRVREQEAYMQSTLTSGGDTPSPSTPEEIWTQLAPHLEDAMGKLNAADRALLVLRFYENKSGPEAAALLGIREDAAHKRVSRALEKLRKFFTKRGVTLTATAIAGAVSANSVQAAPVGLAKTVTAVALAKGATASISTLTLVKGALKIMAWTKAKTAVVACAPVLFAVCVTPHIWYYHLSPNSWRHRFEAAYRLKPGQAIRFVRPPFIPERLTYYRTQNPLQAKSIPSGPDNLVFVQDKQGNLLSPIYGFGPKQYPLWLALRTELGLKPYEFEGPKNLLDLPVTGDWTIRQGISQETLLAVLEPILWKVTGHHIIFQKRTVERDVIVATGSHFIFKPLTAIQIYAENVHDNSYDHSGDLKALFDDIGARLELRFIDETTLNSNTPAYETSNLTWSLHQDSDAIAMKNRRTEMTSEVLKHLADQTGLTFTREQRPVPIWFVSEQQPDN